MSCLARGIRPAAIVRIPRRKAACLFVTKMKIGLLDVTKDLLLIVEFIKHIDPSSLKVSLRIGVDNKLLKVE